MGITWAQHGHKVQHSTGTALRVANNIIAKARTFVVVIDMSKAFDTVNIHILVGKLLYLISISYKHSIHY